MRLPSVLAALWSLVVASAPTSHAAERPNILILTVDDMSADSMGPSAAS